jgi:hypothetical protein
MADSNTSPDLSKADQKRAFHLYVDESSKSATYYGVGAIFCRSDSAPQIASAMSAAIALHKQRPDKEIHWTELKGHLLPLYRDVALKLIGYAQPNGRMRYRALMIESAKVSRAVDRDANREDILAKFIFTVVYQFAREFGPNLDYHVFVDSPSTDSGQAPSARKRLAEDSRRTGPQPQERHGGDSHRLDYGGDRRERRRQERAGGRHASQLRARAALWRFGLGWPL